MKALSRVSVVLGKVSSITLIGLAAIGCNGSGSMTSSELLTLVDASGRHHQFADRNRTRIRYSYNAMTEVVTLSVGTHEFPFDASSVGGFPLRPGQSVTVPGRLTGQVVDVTIRRGSPSDIPSSPCFDETAYGRMLCYQEIRRMRQAQTRFYRLTFRENGYSVGEAEVRAE